MTLIVKGFLPAPWEKGPARRHEALDCRAYVRAAAAIHGRHRFEERPWRRMEEVLGLVVAVPALALWLPPQLLDFR